MDQPTPQLIRWLKDNDIVPSTLTIDEADPFWKETVKEALLDGRLPAETYSELSKEAEAMTKTPTPEKVFGGSVNVKAPSEKYSTKRWTAKHRKTGEEILNPLTGTLCEEPSQLDKIKCGLTLKLAAKRAGLPVEWHEGEPELLEEMRQGDDWIGDGKICRGAETKALLDDSTSGGLEIAPIVFDELAITFPLLTSEILPYVDLVTIPRGRRVEGASIATPTVSWGVGDATAITVYNTANMVLPVDTSIHDVAGAVEVGRNFATDAGLDVFGIVRALYAERMASELDIVVCVGNGTNRPQGITLASGITSVPSDNGNGGPPTVGDYESLLFSVAKQYRTRALEPCFIGNETSYQRSRSIAVGATDERRVFGMTHEDYSLLSRPYRICTSLANTQILFACLRKYRLYRRQGTTLEVSTQGDYLMRSNLALLVCRGRYGGQLMDANTVGYTSDAQS